MDELEKELNNCGINRIIKWKLNKNYRTEKSVLEEIQKIVEKWKGPFGQKLEPMNDNGGVQSGIREIC